MKYFWDDRQVSREKVRQFLLEEYEMAKDSRYFQGRIFYNLDYLEHCATQHMARTKEDHWSNFSLRIEA